MTDLESFYKILKESGRNEINLTFEQLNSILGGLPEASKYRTWWSNDNSNEYSKTWYSAGYSVTKVIPDFYVCFTKTSTLKNNDSEENKNTVESIRALHNKADATKASDDNSVRIAGVVMLILDFIICIPIIFSSLNDFDTILTVLIVGGIIGFISICCIGAGNGGGYVGGGGGYSGSFYEHAMYNEMRSHNARMEQMMRESQMQRLQEETNRRHESEPSLAERFDGRITNIFRNPWEGIL